MYFLVYGLLWIRRNLNSSIQEPNLKLFNFQARWKEIVAYYNNQVRGLHKEFYGLSCPVYRPSAKHEGHELNSSCSWTVEDKRRKRVGRNFFLWSLSVSPESRSARVFRPPLVPLSIAEIRDHSQCIFNQDFVGPVTRNFVVFFVFFLSWERM